MLFFWLIFLTLMLPVEVRIVPTYEVVAGLGCSTATGLILPLIASATATFLFRQFFMTIPDELTEAARRRRGPIRFFIDILLPMSPHQHRGAVRHPLHLRLEPVSLAAADHHDPSMNTSSWASSRCCRPATDGRTGR
jgi:hypothetical protein